jgi:hypothetical protein
MLNPFNISLRARGRVIRRIQNADRSPSLPEIVQLIGGPSWISEPRPGVMYLRAALIAESGATFTVAPFARRLLMADIPGVFLGGVSGPSFTRNVVSHNVFYGVDPHTHSRNLTIRRNTVTGNGRHGIILRASCPPSATPSRPVRTSYGTPAGWPIIWMLGG